MKNTSPSHVTWSAGISHYVAPVHTFIAAAFILLTAAELAAGPPLRPEIALGAPGREAITSTDVSAASSGSEALAVWNDGRGGAFATIIEPHGTIRHPWGVSFGSMKVPPDHAVAWTGDSYVVLLLGQCCDSWTVLVDRNGAIRRPPVSTGSMTAQAVYANSTRTLMLASNSIFFLDSAGLATKVGQLPAGTRKRYGVVRDDGFTIYALDSSLVSGGMLHRVHVDNAGTVSDKLLQGEWLANDEFGAVTDGVSDMLVWAHRTPAVTPAGWSRVTILYTLLDDDGTRKVSPTAVYDQAVNWPNVYTNEPWTSAPAAAWDGREFAFTYVRSEGSAGTSLVPVRVSATGTMIDRNDAAVAHSVLAPTTAGMRSTMVSIGQRQLLLWNTAERGNDWSIRPLTSFRVFDDFGSFYESDTQTLAGGPPPESQPAVSSDGSSIATVWRESAYTGTIAAQVVNARGVPSATTPLSDGTMDALQPAVANGGGVFLAAWREIVRDSTSGYPLLYRIVIRRLGVDGTLLDPTPVLLQSGTYGSENQYRASVYNVAVGWDGSHFQVAWSGGDGQVYTESVSPGGERLGPSLLLASGRPAESMDIRMVNLGNDVFVLYYARDSKVYSDPFAIEGIRLSRSHSPASVVTFVPVSEFPYYSIPFEAAWNGTNLVLGWQRGQSASAASTIVARLYDIEGRAAGPQVTVGSPVPSASIGQFVADGSSWWLLTRVGHLRPVLQKLDEHLAPSGKAIDISPWGSSVGDALGVFLGTRIVVVYARLGEIAPEALAQRLFMQWIFLQPRERAVRP